jgi:hypothetical protein
MQALHLKDLDEVIISSRPITLHGTARREEGEDAKVAASACAIARVSDHSEIYHNHVGLPYIVRQQLKLQAFLPLYICALHPLYAVPNQRRILSLILHPVNFTSEGQLSNSVSLTKYEEKEISDALFSTISMNKMYPLSVEVGGMIELTIHSVKRYFRVSVNDSIPLYTNSVPSSNSSSPTVVANTSVLPNQPSAPRISIRTPISYIYLSDPQRAPQGSNRLTMPLPLPLPQIGEPSNSVFIPAFKFSPPSTQLSELCGVSSLLQSLKLHLNLMLCSQPSIRTKFHSNNYGVYPLLTGEVGMGKSTILRALCWDFIQHSNANVHFVNCSDLIGKESYDNAEKFRQFVNQIISEAVQCAPSLIVFDDLDSMFPFLTEEDNIDPSYKFSIQQKMDIFRDCFAAFQSRSSSLWKPGQHNICLIASATSLHSCHSLAASLFSAPYHIPSLHRDSKMHLIQYFCRILNVSPPSIDSLPSIVERMEGYRVRDIYRVVRRAYHASQFSLSWRTNSANSLTHRPDNKVSPLLSSSSSASSENSYVLVPPDASIVDSEPNSVEPLSLSAFRSNTLTINHFDQAFIDFQPTAIVKPPRNAAHSFRDIGGMHSIKQTLKDTLELPTRYMRLFARIPLKLRSGLLLYGPPGMCILPIYNIVSLIYLDPEHLA